MKKIAYLFVVVLCATFTSCVNTIANSPGASINNGNSGSAQGRGGWITGGLQFGIGPSRSGSSCSPGRQSLPPIVKTTMPWSRPCGNSCRGRTCGYTNCRSYGGSPSYRPQQGYSRGYQPQRRPSGGPIPPHSGYGPNTGIAGWLNSDTPPRGVTYYSDVTNRNSQMGSGRR